MRLYLHGAFELSTFFFKKILTFFGAQKKGAEVHALVGIIQLQMLL